MLPFMRPTRRRARPSRSPIGRMLRHALAVWLLFCGCEWTALVRFASAVGPVEARGAGTAASCCCCTATCGFDEGADDTEEGGAESDPDADLPAGRGCTGDCCVKFAEPRTVAPTMVDEVGAAPAPWIVPLDERAVAARHGDPRALRRPPPVATPPRAGRRILLETARMRVEGGRRVS